MGDSKVKHEGVFWQDDVVPIIISLPEVNYEK